MEDRSTSRLSICGTLTLPCIFLWLCSEALLPTSTLALEPTCLGGLRHLRQPFARPHRSSDRNATAPTLAWGLSDRAANLALTTLLQAQTTCIMHCSLANPLCISDRNATAPTLAWGLSDRAANLALTTLLQAQTTCIMHCSLANPLCISDRNATAPTLAWGLSDRAANLALQHSIPAPLEYSYLL